MSERLRIGLLAGVPASLGGGGLERQARCTGIALRERGHDVFVIAQEPEPRAFDLLHAFGAEPDTWQWLSHWRRNVAPLVVSPVMVVPPRRERLERLVGRAPLRSWGPRMRADVLRRSDLVVAQTEHEARLVAALGASSVVVVPNGVDVVDELATNGSDDASPYVLLLGTVSRRKRQRETLSAIHDVRAVVVGGFEGSAAERAAFEAEVAARGASWRGEVHDRTAVLALVRDAEALVHLSQAEGQALALLEALAVGTPVIVSDLPANRELAARYPEHVYVVGSDDQLDARIAAARRAGRVGPAPIPRWADVAEELERHYVEILGRSGSGGA